jgi:hypothetical protein
MVLFEWDAAKNESNQRKHGVSFEDASQVFDDPYALARQDRIESGEYRWQTIGLAEGNIAVTGGPHCPGRRKGRNHPYHLSSSNYPKGAHTI